MKPNKDQQIAVVSISCRFPNANNPKEFWNLLMEGQDIITEVPSDRWNKEEFYSPLLDAKGKTNQKNGAFLNDIHKFDPLFFNISPKEAIEMSPSQKLMLELAWELVENASIPYDEIKGTNTGVYIGNIWNDFENLRKQRNAEINSFSAIGLSSNIIANRISYFMGLTGPSFVVDTGCSSSLVALTLAIQSLRDGSADACIAGGINHILNEDHYIYLAKFGGLSSAGKCNSFSADADGFVRAEGAGLVLLKRLSDAIKDGDKIHAVIIGAAMNNNGFNENMPATSITGQLDLLKRAYDDAKIEPKLVQYVETHGTGTRLGDPVEAKALGKFFSDSRINGDKLIIGSVKTNLGHTEAASGIAGLIKTLLAIEKGIIPKNLNFGKPNPKIDLEKSKIEVLKENYKWDVRKDQTRIAGVSSFGWGGTNAHLVLEEFRPIKNKEIIQDHIQKDHLLLTLSARSEAALIDYVKLYKNYLSDYEEDSNEDLAKICAATALFKPEFEYRKAFFGSNKQELLTRLNEFIDNNDDNINSRESKNGSKVVFVFPGQGSQWFGMGKELYEKEVVFKEAIDKCNQAFSKYVDWSLKDEIFTDKEKSKIDRIDIIQPYIFAIQVAIAELWASWGITPDSVVGHSMGEVAAAYIAGILNIDDAANIICSRSILMNTLKGQDGAMAVAGISAVEAQKILNKYNGDLSIAVENSPKSTVVAGKQVAIDLVIKELEKKEIFAKKVKVDVASHSPQMDSIKNNLINKVKNIKAQSSIIDIYSSVKGKKLKGTEFDKNYWGDNLRNAVKFSTVMQQLIIDGHTLFVEVSPHPVLKTSMWECVNIEKNTKVDIITSLNRDEPELTELKKNLTFLYEQGYSINKGAFFTLNQNISIKLPSYPFQRENYEIKDLSALEGSKPSGELHPLLGKAIHLAESKTYYWESDISSYNLPILKEHKVNDNTILPASFYVEMIFAAVKQIRPQHNYLFCSIQFIDSVVITEDKPVKIQLKISTEENKLQSFKFFRYNNEEDSWSPTCTGQICRKNNYVEPSQIYSYNTTSKVIEKQTIYTAFLNMGVEFGESFRNILKIEKDNTNHAIAHMAFNDEILFSDSKYVIHPVILDNCIHPAFAKVFSVINNETIKSAFVIGIEKLILFNNQPSGMKYEARLKLYPVNKDKNSLKIKSDICLFDINNQPILEMIGVEARISDTKIKREIAQNESGISLLEKLRNESDVKIRIEIIETHLSAIVAKIIKASVQMVKPSMSFKNLGIDSIATVMLMSMLEKEFEVPITVQKFKDHPTIKEFSSFINGLLKNEENWSSNQSKKEVSAIDRWFIKPYPNPKAKHLLFLFHDAGGSKDLFESWHQQIDKNIEMIVVQLPGRNERTDEAPYQDVNKLLADLVPLMNEVIDRPYSIYGHSMGGLLGFEVARSLQKEYQKSPAKLLVSGTPALRDYENKFVNFIIENQLTEKDIHALIPKFQRFDFNDDVVKNMIELLMNDLKLIHSYKYVSDEILSSAIVAIHAVNDVRVQLHDVKKWKGETEKQFKLFEVPGSHNFIYNKSEIITSLINSELSNNITEEFFDKKIIVN